MYTLLLIIITTTGGITSTEIEDVGNYVQCGTEKNIILKAMSGDTSIRRIIGRCVKTY